MSKKWFAGCLIAATLALIIAVLYFFLGRGQTAVKVGSDKITQSMVENRVADLEQSSRSATPSNRSFQQSLRQAALNSLIEEHWLVLEAERQGVRLDPVQVRQRMIADKGSATNLNDRLLRSRATQMTLRNALLSRQSVVTQPSDARFSRPDLSPAFARNLSIIYSIDIEQALAAKFALTRGQSFDLVQRQFAQPGSSLSGDKRRVTPGRYGQAVEEQLQAARPGQIVGPLPYNGGWIVVLYRSPSQAAERSQQQTSQGSERLLAQSRQFDRSLRARWQPQTVCYHPWRSPLCARVK